MRRILPALTVLFLLGLGGGLRPSRAQAGALIPPGFRRPGAIEIPAYAPDRVLVWFAPGAVTLPAGASSAPLSALLSSAPLEDRLRRAGAIELRRLGVSLSVSRRGLAPLTADVFVVTLSDTSVAAAIATLSAAAPEVKLVEPDWARTVDLVPDDFLFNTQWWLRNTGRFGGPPGIDLHAETAWDITTGGDSVDVVVIDTGCDPTHPDLAGRVIYGPNVVGDGTSYDLDGHGTSVAGIIAAQGNNSIGVAGVDWTARIHAVKAIESVVGNVSNLVAGLNWAREQGYKLVNLSAGSQQFSRIEQLACRDAYMDGMVVFAAAGNDNCECVHYPAADSPFTVGVGAMMDTGDRWNDDAIDWASYGFGTPFPYGGSNTGPAVRFLAPGGRFIATTQPVALGSYVYADPPVGQFGFGGTSAAAPAATGVAALLLSVSPNLTGEDLGWILERTADDLIQYGVGRDDTSGAGSINAARALALVTGTNVVQHGTAQSTSEVSRQSGLQRTVLDWPGIAAGVYQAVKHVVRGVATYSVPFQATPEVWPRRVSSLGAGSENPIAYAPTRGSAPPPWTPAVWMISADAGRAVFETYVYELIPTGGGQRSWWPTTPQGVRFDYTAIGTPAISAPAGRALPPPSAFAMTAGPSPAFASAQLRVTLPEASAVEIGVYDLGGRRVRAMYSGALSEGPHAWRWDLRDDHGAAVAPGIYFARLTTSRRAEVARIAVLRSP